MSVTVPFALNHITAPRLGSRALIDLAVTLGCSGIELRNDLVDKQLTDRPLFDDEKPAAIGDYAKEKGVRLLGLSEVYGFNRWSDKMRVATELLVAQAKDVGAGSISLIPSNDGEALPDDTRLTNLRHALQNVLPILERANMMALVEPLGFTTSSLRRKWEAVRGDRGRQRRAPLQAGSRHVSSFPRQRARVVSASYRNRAYFRGCRARHRA